MATRSAKCPRCGHLIEFDDASTDLYKSIPAS